jgi:hypothetical protein
MLVFSGSKNVIVIISSQPSEPHTLENGATEISPDGVIISSYPTIFNEKWLAHPTNYNAGADHRVIFRAALWETGLGNVSGEAHPRDVGWNIAGFLPSACVI